MILKDCVQSDERVESILLSDYMSLHKQKPKKIDLQRVTKEEMIKCYNLLIEKGLSHQKECYHYGRVEYYYENEICYQVLISTGTEPKPPSLIGANTEIL